MMRKFLDKYRVPLRIIAFIVCSLLAVSKWLDFSRTNRGMDMIGGVIWSAWALIAVWNLIASFRPQHNANVVEDKDKKNDLII